MCISHIEFNGITHVFKIKHGHMSFGYVSSANVIVLIKHNWVSLILLLLIIILG